MERLLEALAVTLELTGTTVSEAAVRVMAKDLAVYPVPQVIAALDKCRKQVRGRLTVADIISRLEDGRPGPEEAWAMLPRDEDSSVVWTEEMATAWGVALPLLNAGDQVASRMAFLERYRTLVQSARDAGERVKWTPSLGTDAYGRESVLLDAVEKGRLSVDHVAGLLPHRENPNPRLLAMLEHTAKPL
jgi:hypothetical protein